MGADPLEVLREIYIAFNRRDSERMLDLVESDFELHLGEHLLDEDLYAGAEQLTVYVDGLATTWEQFALELEELIPAGDQVVALVRTRATGGGSGIDVDARIAHVWTMRAGRPVRMDLLPRDEGLKRAGIAHS